MNDKKAQKIFIFALAFSLGTHLFVTGAAYLSAKKTNHTVLQTTEMEMISPEELEKRLVQNKKSMNENNKPKQMADSEEAPNQELPDDGFLGKKNQKVERQTKASNVGALQKQMIAKGQKNGLLKPVNETQVEVIPSKNKASLAAPVAKEPNVVLAVSPTENDIEVQKTKTSTLPGSTSKTEPTLKSAEVSPPKTVPEKSRPHPDQLSLKHLLPSLGVPKSEDSNTQAAQTDDYFKDVVADGKTLLNTREHLYFSYYSRIKDRLRQYLDKALYEKVMESMRRGRYVASQNKKIAQFMLVLDSKGILIKAYLLDPSGMQELDQAAHESLQAAAPFPNPPKGMIEEDGNVRVRWNFVY